MLGIELHVQPTRPLRILETRVTEITQQTKTVRKNKNRKDTIYVENLNARKNQGSHTSPL